MNERFEEWRVIGEPGYGGQTFDFVWSPDRNPKLGDSETAARKFINTITKNEHKWESGPFLMMRHVERTKWTHIED